MKIFRNISLPVTLEVIFRVAHGSTVGPQPVSAKGAVQVASESATLSAKRSTILGWPISIG